MTRRAGREFSAGRTGIGMKVLGERIRRMGKEFLLGLTALFMKVSLWMDCRREGG